MVKSLIFSNFVKTYHIQSIMIFSAALDQYMDICRDSVKDSSAKLNKSFVKTLIEVLLLMIVIPTRRNFTQFAKYGSRGEQCYRQAFNRVKAKSVNWLRFNIYLAKRYFGDEGGLKAIAIDPSYISKSGKKTPHIGRFWSGCAGAVKHGLEVMGIGLIDISKNNCIMLRAHQTPNSTELNVRSKSLIQHYIGVIKRYGRELIKLSDIVVADAFFSTKTFADGIKGCGFFLVSRFRDDAVLMYLYTGPKTGKRGRPKLYDGKIAPKKLDYSKMEKLEIEGLDGKAYTLLAYSKAMKSIVRLVIWIMPNGRHKLFFSNKTALTGEEVLRLYRTRFQIEFCYRDAKQFTGLCHSQARHTRQLDFNFNASFAALNVAKVMMKEMNMDYSMSSFKSMMFNSYLTDKIISKCGYKPNQNLISKIFKELIGYQPKAA